MLAAQVAASGLAGSSSRRAQAALASSLAFWQVLDHRAAHYRFRQNLEDHLSTDGHHQLDLIMERRCNIMGAVSANEVRRETLRRGPLERAGGGCFDRPNLHIVTYSGYLCRGVL